MPNTVCEVWCTDTFNLLGRFVGRHKAEEFVKLMEAEGRRPGPIHDTGMTKQEFNNKDD